MNREIKFRAFENGVMYNDLAYITMSGGAFSRIPDRPLIRPILMQFTGLKDKNGKEIYEGDICHWIDNNPDDGDFPINAAMVWQPNNAQFRFDTARYPPQYKKVREEDVEIVGNIYENPELLNP